VSCATGLRAEGHVSCVVCVRKGDRGGGREEREEREGVREEQGRRGGEKYGCGRKA